MAFVKARPNESIDSLLNRFKRKVDNDGILTTVRKKEYYEKPSVRKRKKRAAAIKRDKKIKEQMVEKPNFDNWQWNEDRTKKIPFSIA